MPCGFQSSITKTKIHGQSYSNENHENRNIRYSEFPSDSAYGRRPSSRGSHVSVMSVDPIDVIWWRPTILLCIITRNRQINTYNQTQLTKVTDQSINRSAVSGKTLISSTMVTVLLMALPIALNTISFEPFSYS